MEPYAGGASASLELLHWNLVDRIGISDSDPMVAAFWETMFEDADWLCQKIETIPVDLENWRRIKRGRYTALRSLAIACLFLNRTSFNGSLNNRAGPILWRASQISSAIEAPARAAPSVSTGR